MSRWQPGTRERLERAALELFAELGFAETTVPQIAARAGLTTRTFFRHFADKREVLFAGDEEIPALAARLVIEAPASISPMMVIASGLQTVAVTNFEGRLDDLRTRRAVIQADEGLRERELSKLSAMSDAIGRAFRDRGLDELTALLAAQLAVTVFSVTISRWLDEVGEQPLSDLVHDTLRALRAVVADPAEQPPLGQLDVRRG